MAVTLKTIYNANMGFFRWLRSETIVNNTIPVIIGVALIDILSIMVQDFLEPLIARERLVYKILKPILKIIAIGVLVYLIYFLKEK